MPYPIRVLRDRISDEMRAAMKAREQTRVSTLRMLMAAMKNTQVEKGHELSDDEVLEVVAREAKRRRESMEAFEKGGRSDHLEDRVQLLGLNEGRFGCGFFLKTYLLDTPGLGIVVQGWREDRL